MEDSVETKATPEEGGASTLDRLTRYLSAEEAPETKDQPDEGGNSERESVDTDDGGKETSDQPQLTTSDLAKLLGVDETALDLDEDGSVKFKTKIDGTDGAAKLADVLKSYQLEGHVNKKSMELADREKAIQAKAQEAEAQFTQRLQYAEGLVGVAAKQLMAEYQSIDWRTLEQQDPGTAALYRQKFQEKQAELRGVLQNIQHEKSQSEQKNEQRERARLPDLIPEWRDAQVAEKERQELIAWLPKSGLEPGDLDMGKASTIALVRRAMLADRLNSQKVEVENKVRKAPVLVKPGQPAQNSQAKTLLDLKQAVRKSGGKSGSVAAYLLASGKV